MLDTFNWEIEKARHCRVVKGGLDSQSSLSPEGSPTLNARAEFHVKNVSRGGQFITPPVAGFEGHTVLEGLAKFNRLRSSIFHTEASCVNAKKPTSWSNVGLSAVCSGRITPLHSANQFEFDGTVIPLAFHCQAVKMQNHGRNYTLPY